jgi:hypothetical protein
MADWRRPGLTAEQKREIARSTGWWRRPAGPCRRRVVARRGYCRQPNGKRSRAAWRRASRCARSPPAPAEPPRRSAGRSPGTVAATCTARPRRPKRCKLATSPALRELVAAKLALDWSPQQISGWLARTHPGEQARQVSTETIYRSLFVQARGVLRKELMAHLRTRRSVRRSRLASTRGQGRGGIIDAVSIRERPAEADDRAVPGHWEGDLLAGSANSHIATLVERRTRYLLLVKVPSKASASVVDALAAQVQTLPRQLGASLTSGPRRGARRPSAFQHRHRRRGLLLRSAKPLAARHQREHQRSAPPVLSQMDRPVAPFGKSLAPSELFIRGPTRRPWPASATASPRRRSG